MSLYLHTSFTDGELDQSALTASALPPFDNADTTLVKPEWVAEYFEKEFLPMNLMYDAELGKEPTEFFMMLVGEDGIRFFIQSMELAPDAAVSSPSGIQKLSKWLIGNFKLWLEQNIDRLKGAE